MPALLYAVSSGSARKLVGSNPISSSFFVSRIIVAVQVASHTGFDWSCQSQSTLNQLKLLNLFFAESDIPEVQWLVPGVS